MFSCFSDHNLLLDAFMHIVRQISAPVLFSFIPVVWLLTCPFQSKGIRLMRHVAY
ncbi:hypothetical protein [Persicitalea jodogahamensis]|uniref:hypothetical protein n=1 Tax=Persicitalea jodogahamensis TaxID=402147 RepID=UPI00366B5AE4